MFLSNSPCNSHAGAFLWPTVCAGVSEEIQYGSQGRRLAFGQAPRDMEARTSEAALQPEYKNAAADDIQGTSQDIKPKMTDAFRLEIPDAVGELHAYSVSVFRREPWHVALTRLDTKAAHEVRQVGAAWKCTCEDTTYRGHLKREEPECKHRKAVREWIADDQPTAEDPEPMKTAEQEIDTRVTRYDPGARTPEDVRGQVQLIHRVLKDVMTEGEHYGIIPGTSRKDAQGKELAKPTLYKPGAEKLLLTFRLAAKYSIECIKDGDHREIISTCTLTHIPTGDELGDGMGSCSTRESKYAWRKASRVCPECGKAAIIKGKDEYGGGWLCWQKEGKSDGCGAKFADDDPDITDQPTGRVPNPDIPDTWNTVLKIANKRSLVAAVLNATAASDLFTQDLEDLGDPDETAKAPRKDRQPPQQSQDRGQPEQQPARAAQIDPASACAAQYLGPGGRQHSRL